MTSWWSAEPAGSAPQPSSRTEDLRRRLVEDRILLDWGSPGVLRKLRSDASRIAREMDRGGKAPPMMWSGIPFPRRPKELTGSDYWLVVSIGGTKTEYGLLRLEQGQLRLLDPAGREQSGENVAAVRKASMRFDTPTHDNTANGLEMIERIVEPIAAYLRSNQGRLSGRVGCVLSWGFANRVVRTAERVIGGVAAITTLMTKDQERFTPDLKDRDLGLLFKAAVERRTGLELTVTVANDGVMALHRFLTPENLAAHAAFGLFINGTGTNFAAAERYSVRSQGVASRAGEVYEPRRLSRADRPAPGEREELFFVNYETGSIPLGWTKTRYDVPAAYPIEHNALSGGNAFEQQLREIVKAHFAPGLYEKLVESRRAVEPRAPEPRGPEVKRLATEGPPAAREVFPGLVLDDLTVERLCFAARAVIARSALHAALILAGVTEHSGFGRGSAAKPDLLAMEGSVWSTPGYPELVRRAWEAMAGGNLHVTFTSEASYNASLPGPLYFAVIHQ